MKKIIFLLLFLIFFIQFSFLPFVAPGSGIKSEPVLAFIFACCLVFNYEILIPMLLIGGFLLDIFSAYAFGILFIPMLIVSILLRDVSEKIMSDKKNYFLIFLVFVLGKILFSFLMTATGKIYGLIGIDVAPAALELKNSAFWLNAAFFSFIGLFFFFIADKIHKSFVRDRIEIGME